MHTAYCDTGYLYRGVLVYLIAYIYNVFNILTSIVINSCSILIAWILRSC